MNGELFLKNLQSISQITLSAWLLPIEFNILVSVRNTARILLCCVVQCCTPVNLDWKNEGNRKRERDLVKKLL